MYNGKNVLIAGGTGLLGIPLVELLIEQGAHVRIASLSNAKRAHPKAEFLKLNLLEFKNCLEACSDMDYVFNLLGVKGSPAINMSRPASFFVPTIILSLNLMEAARQCKVERFLYTSSVAVYPAEPVFYEDHVWNTFPAPTNKHSGWAKRMGELQAETYKIEYGWDKIAIARPVNVYGPYDNFELENALVIPSLIRKAIRGENPLRVWGDGTPIRDFIHTRDAARGLMLAMEHITGEPINIGTGVGVSIKELVNIIVSNLEIKPDVVWDTSMPLGEKSRVADISRAKKIGFKPEISLEQGIKEVMAWYKAHCDDEVNSRYDVFSAGGSERLLV